MQGQRDSWVVVWSTETQQFMPTGNPDASGICRKISPKEEKTGKGVQRAGRRRKKAEERRRIWGAARNRRRMGLVSLNQFSER